MVGLFCICSPWPLHRATAQLSALLRHRSPRSSPLGRHRAVDRQGGRHATGCLRPQSRNFNTEASRRGVTGDGRQARASSRAAEWITGVHPRAVHCRWRPSPSSRSRLHRCASRLEIPRLRWRRRTPPDALAAGLPHRILHRPLAFPQVVHPSRRAANSLLALDGSNSVPEFIADLCSRGLGRRQLDPR